MKRAIVVGASSGIGRELASVLAERGYVVGATGRRAELLDELSSGAGGRIVAAAFDACSSDIAKELGALVERLGGLDLFVFCAGTGDLNPDLDYGIESRTNRLNVDAFTAAVGFAYGYFARHGGGHIAAVTSVMGLRGSGAAPSYAASKAYQINYLEGLRQKAAKERTGITITDLRPGSVETDMMKGEGHFWIASPTEAARVIAGAIGKKKAVAYVTPRWQTVGTLLKWLPRNIHKNM